MRTQTHANTRTQTQAHKHTNTLWHDQCNWAQYNTSISDSRIIQVLTKSEYCFQGLKQVTEDKLRRQQTHNGDKAPDVSDTISHRVSEYAENSKLTSIALLRVRGLALHRVRGVTRHGIRTVQSVRNTQIQIRIDPNARTPHTEIRTALRTRNNQHNTLREVSRDEEMTQCFSNWANKRTALEPVLRKPQDMRLHFSICAQRNPTDVNQDEFCT